jgi:hypothetical protein
MLHCRNTLDGLRNAEILIFVLQTRNMNFEKKTAVRQLHFVPHTHFLEGALAHS